MVLSDVRVLEECGNSFSFPSGHAAKAFLAATILSGFFVRRKKLFFTLAALVAFSRIYLGVHYPSDVLAGFALGTFWLALGTRFATRL